MTLPACIRGLGWEISGDGLPIETSGTKVEELLVRVERPCTTAVRGSGEIGADGRASCT